PAEAHARKLYDAVEEVRCQALGARALPGVARNLTAALADDLARTEASRHRDDQAAAQIGALLLLIRERLTEAAPPAAGAPLVERWRDDLLRRSGMTLGRLVPVIADQAAFARVCRDLLRDLGFTCDAASPTGTPGRPERPRGAAPRAAAAGDCSEQIAVEAGEPPRLLAGRAGEATDAVPVTVPAAPDHGTASASDRNGPPPAA
ncbi:Cobalt chelatase, CobT subunit, partial [mine drainage metagenome]